MEYFIVIVLGIIAAAATLTAFFQWRKKRSPENPIYHSHARILIADNSSISSRKLKNILEKEGHTVVLSHSGGNVIELVDEHNIEVILLERKLPDISGRDILKLLKSTERTKDIPVIIISHIKSGSLVKKALSSGAVDYIRKGSEPIEVIARIYSAIELKHKQDWLKELTQKDGLTKIYNRQYFNTTIEELMTKKSCYSDGISLIMLDCDHFKRINDCYGHTSGDKVLVSLANTLYKSVQSTDIACRFGGEEFCLILPNTGISHAYEIAERIRTNIQKTLFTFQDQKVNVTVSCGVAHTESEDDKSAIKLLNEADEALYTSKEYGRNCTKLCLD